MNSVEQQVLLNKIQVNFKDGVKENVAVQHGKKSEEDEEGMELERRERHDEVEVVIEDLE